MARPDLKLVPEDFVATSASSPEDRAKAHQAAGIREGIRREKVKSEATLTGVKSAHVDELNRSGVLIARASHRDGLWHGMVLGGLAVALIMSAALYAGAWLQTSGFTMRVANERIPRAQVPVLQDEGNAPVTYESHGCEPGACGR